MSRSRHPNTTTGVRCEGHPVSVTEWGLSPPAIPELGSSANPELVPLDMADYLQEGGEIAYVGVDLLCDAWPIVSNSVKGVATVALGRTASRTDNERGGIGVAHAPPRRHRRSGLRALSGRLAHRRRDGSERDGRDPDLWQFHEIAQFRSLGQEIVAICLERGIGVIGMKTLGGGVITGQAGISGETWIRYALSQPVSTIFVGMTSMEELRQNVATTRAFESMPTDEQDELVDRIRLGAGDGRDELYKRPSGWTGVPCSAAWIRCRIGTRTRAHDLGCGMNVLPYAWELP